MSDIYQFTKIVQPWQEDRALFVTMLIHEPIICRQGAASTMQDIPSQDILELAE